MQQNDAAKLQEFVEASKAKGASDEFLASFLTRRGWPQDDVYAALGDYWSRVTGLPVPDRTAGGESSRDAFLYLLSFSTLATWSGSLGSMLFRFIDHWFPDPVAPNLYYNLRNAVTWQMASVVVAFPIFLIVMRTILNEAQAQPERLQSGVRKWLTYIALLLTAGAMICDLIWFLDYFLMGELTSRFVLKSLTVMVICGAIFIYYLGSLRWDRNTNVAEAKRRSLKFAIGPVIAVVACFCIGLGLAGTPNQQRRMEADHKRVQDLRAIADAIYVWHQRAANSPSAAQLPPTLTALTANGIAPAQLVDPETQKGYEYRALSNSTYDLCAVFSAASETSAQFASGFWSHGAGRACFNEDASQRRY